MSSTRTSDFFGSAGASYQSFPNPFIDVALRSMPDQLYDIYRLCEHLYTLFGVYRQSQKKVSRYFLTPITFANVEDDERQTYDELAIRYKMRSILARHDDTLSAYGNVFITLYEPFDRYLSCPQCGAQFPIRELARQKAAKFRYSEGAFKAVCQSTTGRCARHPYDGAFKVHDRRGDPRRDLAFRFWDPKEIRLRHNPNNDTNQIYWIIPDEYSKRINEGDIELLATTTLEVLEAIRHRQAFRFEPDVMYHGRVKSLPGIKMHGWGMPPVVMHFPEMFTSKSLQRATEAIALDFVTPLRVISPKTAPVGSGQATWGDTAGSLYDLGGLRSDYERAFRQRRLDPTFILFSPVPIEYQLHGGEARQLAPVDLIAYYDRRLQNDIGTPLEFGDNSIQWQAIAPALRLFESLHIEAVEDKNQFLTWGFGRIAALLKTDAPQASLQSATIVDDLNRIALLQQGLAQGDISPSWFYRNQLGVDHHQQTRQALDDAQYKQQQQAKKEKEMQQSGMALQMAQPQQDPAQGGQPQGAAPQGGQAQGGPVPGAGGSVVDQYLMTATGNETPMDQETWSKAIAEELLGKPDAQKNLELRKLLQTRPTVHAAVKDLMKRMREQTKTQLFAQAQQQGALSQG